MEMVGLSKILALEHRIVREGEVTHKVRVTRGPGVVVEATIIEIYTILIANLRINMMINMVISMMISMIVNTIRIRVSTLMIPHNTRRTYDTKIGHSVLGYSKVGDVITLIVAKIYSKLHPKH